MNKIYNPVTKSYYEADVREIKLTDKIINKILNKHRVQKTLQRLKEHDEGKPINIDKVKEKLKL